MTDDSLVIRPKSAWHQSINWQTLLSVISFVISISSAIFSWQQVRVGNRQAVAAERQANISGDALKESRVLNTAQKNDVELARKAAEASAKSAQKLADGMERSAKAAELSASAGRESLALNRRALILSNEPFVEVHQVQLAKPLAPDEKPVVTAKLVNTGKGRAVGLKSSMWLRVADVRSIVYSDIITSPSVMDLGPSESSSTELSIALATPLSTELINQIQSGQLQMFAYGLSEYLDNTLEKPKKYVLHWCAFYDRGAQASTRFRVCAEHNFTSVD